MQVLFLFLALDYSLHGVIRFEFRHFDDQLSSCLRSLYGTLLDDNFFIESHLGEFTFHANGNIGWIDVDFDKRSIQEPR